MIDHISESLSFFRDDLFPMFGGGNKARKMWSLHETIASGGFNALVTTGGIQSNHCRAVALYTKKFGLDCTLVLHGKEQDFLNELGNAKIIRSTSSRVLFCEPESISSNMDKAMQNFEKRGRKPFYIYGGGHILEAAKCYIETVEKLAQEYVPDYIFVASGTGSTHAGILAGISKLNLPTKVIGISVGRPKAKAEPIVREFYLDLCRKYDINSQNDNVFVEDAFLCGGYGKFNDEIWKIQNNSLTDYNVFLDTTYTAKTFHGMQEVIKRESMTGKILFWYTGGQFNYFAS